MAGVKSDEMHPIMRLGLLKERRAGEHRIALTPGGVRQLGLAGWQVMVEQDAGIQAGFSNETFIEAGATVSADMGKVIGDGHVVLKVKTPLPEEIARLQPGQELWAFLVLDRHPDLRRMLADRRVICRPLEALQDADGRRPLLMAMSHLAGQQAVLLGSELLGATTGGVGISLPACPGLPMLQTVVLGGGAAGMAAALTAAALGARVQVVEQNQKLISGWAAAQVNGITMQSPTVVDLTRLLALAHLLINTVPLPPGHPPLVTREMVQCMPAGSVIIDVAARPNGAVATIDRLTTLAAPAWDHLGVRHCAIPNLPSRVPRTASQALSMALVPFLLARTA